MNNERLFQIELLKNDWTLTPESIDWLLFIEFQRVKVANFLLNAELKNSILQQLRNQLEATKLAEIPTED